MRGQGLRGGVVGGDGDDVLVASAQLVDRAQAEMLDAADDDVAVGPGRIATWRAVYGRGMAAVWMAATDEVRYHPRPVGP